MTALVLAGALGFAAGVLSGMFGVGGGILFVPTLALVLGLTQLEAQATSLAAIIPVVADNVAWRAALVIGVASAAGVAGGAAIAEAISDDALRKLFAGLLIVTAIHLVVTARR